MLMLFNSLYFCVLLVLSTCVSTPAWGLLCMEWNVGWYATAESVGCGVWGIFVERERGEGEGGGEGEVNDHGWSCSMCR